MAKTIQYTYNTFFKLFEKYIGFHNIFFQTWRGIALPCQNVEGKQYSHQIVMLVTLMVHGFKV